MKQYKNGFTFVELIISIAILVILISVAVPSLQSLYLSYHTNSAFDKFQQALNYSRAQAISYGNDISICPIENNKCTNQWQSGYSLFIGTGSSTIENKHILKVFQTENEANYIDSKNHIISFNKNGKVKNNESHQINYFYNNIKTSTHATIQQNGQLSIAHKKNSQG